MVFVPLKDDALGRRWQASAVRRPETIDPGIPEIEDTGRLWRRLGRFSALTNGLLAAAAIALGLLHPETPLPDHWNPTRPLDLSAPETPLTPWKLARSDEGAACLAALATGRLAATPLPDLEVSDQCHIRDRVGLTGSDGVALASVETRCATALRLSAWVEYGLEPAARETFGTGIARVHHLSSYNCRRIRTPGGESETMSTHATADAIDVTGVTLDDGRRIDLATDWGDGERGAFLQSARDSACRWFGTALGPDFNALHADHFHLQTRGGLCR